MSCGSSWYLCQLCLFPTRTHNKVGQSVSHGANKQGSESLYCAKLSVISGKVNLSTTCQLNDMLSIIKCHVKFDILAVLSYLYIMLIQPSKLTS